MLRLSSRRNPAFLASVRNGDEATAALAGGADILDCKDPSLGALGAVAPAVIREILAAAGPGVTVSATIGDLPNDAMRVVRAAEEVAATGVQIVKWGVFEADGAAQVIDALQGLDIGKSQLVAVLMADLPDMALLASLAAAGFAGVMLDTADKSRGALTQILSAAEIKSFIALAHKHNLISGLAGSLRVADIEPLLGYGPGVIGFRGALCIGGRTGAFSSANIDSVARAMDAAAFTDRANRLSRIVA